MNDTITSPASEIGSDPVLLDIVDEHIAVITLNRPDVLNAVNLELYQALERAIVGVQARSDVHAVIVRGAGRAFSAGGDVNFMRDMFEGRVDMHAVQELSLRCFIAMVNLPMPTIAVVDGLAVGFGCTLALSCDLVYASERSSFADPHVQIGLVPGDGGGFLWPLLIGPQRAKEYLFTGDRMPAQEALEAGLIARLYPADEVLDRALAFARRLSAGPSQAIRATKAITNSVIRELGERTVRMSLALEHASQYSEYHRQAVARFLDGDPIRF